MLFCASGPVTVNNILVFCSLLIQLSIYVSHILSGYL